MIKLTKQIKELESALGSTHDSPTGPRRSAKTTTLSTVGHPPNTILASAQASAQATPNLISSLKNPPISLTTMPPKKKSKASAQIASPPPVNEDPMDIDGEELPPFELLNDHWTDDQEASLFKGIMSWKPTGKTIYVCSGQILTVLGMHKHFRMVALSESLRNHGYDERHTRIPGVWSKLRSLYDLDTLDYRDNDFEHDPRLKDKWAEFSLESKWKGIENGHKLYWSYPMWERWESHKRSASEASSPSRSPSPQASKKRKRGFFRLDIRFGVACAEA